MRDKVNPQSQSSFLFWLVWQLWGGQNLNDSRASESGRSRGGPLAIRLQAEAQPTSAVIAWTACAAGLACRQTSPPSLNPSKHSKASKAWRLTWSSYHFLILYRFWEVYTSLKSSDNCTTKGATEKGPWPGSFYVIRLLPINISVMKKLIYIESAARLQKKNRLC